MTPDIREGRFLQLRGRIKRAWAELTGDDQALAQGNAQVVAGALQESYGIAKKQAAQEVARGADALASIAKRAAKIIER
jgi:uncharacterized protein YjbJ (UPF0337 family)